MLDIGCILIGMASNHLLSCSREVVWQEGATKKAPTTASIREVEAISHHTYQAAVQTSFIVKWSVPRSWLSL